MTPKSALHEIIAEVERITGFPVQILDDLRLSVVATVKAASTSVPFTLVRVRPDVIAREYVVAFQCGFVLRQASLPERWEIAASFNGRKEVDRLVRAGSMKLDQSARAAFVENLLGGLITQLRSVPIGLRTDQWIADRYSALADQQRASNESQLNENQAVLAPEIKRMTPPAIYGASAGMNAAMAAYWAAKWSDDRPMVPYKVSGLLDAGKRLLARFNAVPDDPTSDRDLIDSWASELGIQGWYNFV